MDITPLSPTGFATEVVGLDVRQLSQRVFSDCVHALGRHRVLVFRHQTLEPTDFLAFGKRWGTPSPHVLNHLRMPGVPEIMQIGNIGETDRGAQVHHGADYWHTDLSYEAEPASATMLYSVLAPTQGGETQFADMVRAHASLPRDVRERIKDYQIEHEYGAASRGKVAAINDQQRSTVPAAVTHPLVRTHPLHKTQSLYALTGTPKRVQSLDDEASEALLTTLRAHALSETFIYRHPYRVGDLVIWDTTTTLHAASTIPRATGRHDRRYLWRISVKGMPDKVAE
ncbi:MAG: TauD/TfdA family dioxygenase [Pseudomonadota bacterium]